MNAYEEGYEDYCNGEFDCPYVDGTPEADEWDEGWLDAELDDYLGLI